MIRLFQLYFANDNANEGGKRYKRCMHLFEAQRQSISLTVRIFIYACSNSALHVTDEVLKSQLWSMKRASLPGHCLPLKLSTGTPKLCKRVQRHAHILVETTGCGY
jgi:hypothetical protein